MYRPVLRRCNSFVTYQSTKRRPCSTQRYTLPFCVKKDGSSSGRPGAGFKAERIAVLDQGISCDGTAGVPENTKAGDAIEIEIRGIGTLRNKVMAQQAQKPSRMTALRRTVGNRAPQVCQEYTSNSPLISTACPRGKLTIPTAVRAWQPYSSPKSS